MSIRAALPQDLASVVDVHLASFPGFFLSTLGPRFLREFYAGLVQVESGILHVAVDGSDRVVGFVGGAHEQVGFYRTLLRNRLLGFVFAAVPAILRRPRVALRLVRGLGRASGTGDTRSGACLMTIGVHPTVAGTGVGRDLFATFARDIRARGGSEFSLTTDSLNNERANAFYRSLGMRLVRVITSPEGRQLNEFVLHLPAAHPPSQETP